MVEDEGFNTLMVYLEPDYKMPCRKTVTTLMEKLYNGCSASTKHELSNTICGINNRMLDVDEHAVLHHCVVGFHLQSEAHNREPKTPSG